MPFKSNQADTLSRDSDLAVIGIGCMYPGANGPKQLWENVLSKRQEFRSLLNCRLPIVDYYDPDPTIPDKLYIKRAAYIEGFKFDWAKRRIPKSTYESTDIVQWLALEVADAALKDAGLTAENLPREKFGVVVGNSLTGEQSRASTMRLRWPFVRKTVIETAKISGLFGTDLDVFVSNMEKLYKSVFPQVTEDTLQGGLSNTIAGRISNFFDMRGGGYNVDGACASSLLAVSTAANHLLSKDWDIAIAGGVDISLDTFELIGFAKTKALTPTEMRVYDKRGNGFLPGEGCGFVVLKRLEDALASNDSIYAVIKGWGISSDGKGGITAPKAEGQAYAIKKAYYKAGYLPQELDFIEGHGTGTTVGDRVELEGIVSALNHFGDTKNVSIGITSLKSIMGHTKAAAGVGALIKACIGVNRKIIPPTTGCEQPNELFTTKASALYPVLDGKILKEKSIIRAGISAMGFGGINTHITVESPSKNVKDMQLELEEIAIIASKQESELITISASSSAELISRLNELNQEVGYLSNGEISDFSVDTHNEVNASDNIRAVIVAKNQEQILEKIDWLQVQIRTSETLKNKSICDMQQEAWISFNMPKKRFGFLFPGQGSQYLGMAPEYFKRFDWSHEIVDIADSICESISGSKVSPYIFDRNNKIINRTDYDVSSSRLQQTEIAQPAICTVSLLYLTLLEELGIVPNIVGGHSLGELTALYSVGALSRSDLIKMAASRGVAMSEAVEANKLGAMASIAASEAETNSLIGKVTKNGYLTVANINAPLQTIVSGELREIEKFVEYTNKHGVASKILPVSGAFHSQLMGKAAASFSEKVKSIEVVNNFNNRIVSSVDGKILDRGMDVRKHLGSQIVSKVQFMDQVKTMSLHCDCLFEVGPGNVLSALVDKIVENQDKYCSPTAEKHGSDAVIHKAIAKAYVSGANIKWENLSKNRLIRKYKPFSDKVFIDNPCERPYQSITHQNDREVCVQLDKRDNAVPNDTEYKKFIRNILANDFNEENMDAYMQARMGFIADLIKVDISHNYSKKTKLQSQKNIIDNNIVAVTEDNDNDVKIDNRINNISYESNTETEKNIAREKINSEEWHTDAAHVVYKIKTMLVDRAGYAFESINANMRLLDDLNLDSIKAGEMVSSLLMDFGVEGEVDPAKYSNESIEDIAKIVLEAKRQHFDRSSAEDAIILTDEVRSNKITHNIKDELDSNTNLKKITTQIIENRIKELVQDKTGYPVESIDLSLKLLDDLNMDSIKAGEIVTALAQEMGIAGKIDPASMSNVKLEDIVCAVSKEINNNENVEDSISIKNIDAEENYTTSTASLASKNNILSIIYSTVEKMTGYPRESLSDELKLLDDLNLDSIKAGELIANVAKEIGAEGLVDPSNFTNLSLDNISEKLAFTINDGKGVTVNKGNYIKEPKIGEHKVPEASNIYITHGEEDKWVREYTARYLPSEIRKSATKYNWLGKHVAVLHCVGNKRLAEDMGKTLLKCGAEVTVINTEAEGTALESHRLKGEYSHVICIVPIASSVTNNFKEHLNNIVDKILLLSHNAISSKSKNITFVQFMGGKFGTDAASGLFKTCSISGYVKSMYLEQPLKKYSVVDFSVNLSNEVIVNNVIQEIEQNGSFVAAGYDSSGARYTLTTELQHPYEYTKRKIIWGSDDVILVTGGGKGITAACVIALAKEIDAKFALVGSSALDESTASGEIQKTLSILRNMGINSKYFSCDISNSGAVEQLVKNVKRELGSISCVVHGAGVNYPRRAEQVNQIQAINEISPKLLGISNILKSLDEKPPKFVVAFSSIIGTTGMFGNAWYAFSNENLEIFLRNYADNHPESSVSAIAYSVWNEIGMGVKLGSVEILSKQGIGAITSKEGIQRFVKLFKNSGKDIKTIVTSQLKNLPTWKQLRSKENNVPKDCRFVDKVETIEPGVELVAGVHLNVSDDVYLKDHNYKGTLLFPTVFGLEAMVQNAIYLLYQEKPGLNLVGIENIQLKRPITVCAERGANVKVESYVKETEDKNNTIVETKITCEQTGYKIPHFSANLIFSYRENDIKNDRHETSLDYGKNPSLDTSELYGDILFQGPMFQRISFVEYIDNTSTVLQTASGKIEQNKDWYTVVNDFVTADPFCRDTYLQSAQLLTVPKFVLPIGIDKIELNLNAYVKKGQQLIVETKLQEKQDNDYVFNVVVKDISGRVVEKLTGYRLRTVSELPDTPIIDKLENIKRENKLNGTIQQTIKNLLNEYQRKHVEMSLKRIPELHEMEKSTRHMIEKPILELVAKQFSKYTQKQINDHKTIHVKWTEFGKPYVENNEEIHVTLSHDDKYLMCAAADYNIGCDIEQIKHRSPEEWRALLGNKKYKEASNANRVSGVDLDIIGTSIWSAVECIKKIVTGDIGEDYDAKVIEAQNSVVKIEIILPTETKIETLSTIIETDVEKENKRIVTFVVAAQEEKMKLSNEDSSEITRMKAQVGVDCQDGFQHDEYLDQPVYTLSLQPTFRECANLNRNVYFTTYLEWTGKARELFMEEISGNLVPQIASGKWGLVTNWAELKVFGDLKAYDKLFVKFWLGSTYNSVIPLHCDFYRYSNSGTKERLAHVVQETTWVEIIGHGKVKPAEFPPYLDQFLSKAKSKKLENISIEPMIQKYNSNIDLGELQVEVEARPVDSNVLWVENFQTTMEESNLVGNVYYANYFIWQGRVRDLYISKILPEYYVGDASDGEPMCQYSKMDYLRDAMPFDRVEVSMSVRKVYKKGAEIYFSYYRLLNNGAKEKLAVGMQKIVWTKKDREGNTVVVDIPQLLREKMSVSDEKLLKHIV